MNRVGFSIQTFFFSDNLIFSFCSFPLIRICRVRATHHHVWNSNHLRDTDCENESVVLITLLIFRITYIWSFPAPCIFVNSPDNVILFLLSWLSYPFDLILCKNISFWYIKSIDIILMYKNNIFISNCYKYKNIFF